MTVPETVVVLLVEDDPIDAEVVTRNLAKQVGGQRYDVIHAVHNHEAQQVLQQRRIDVVLLDLTLPDSRGLDTFLGVRAHSGTVPIVVLTSLDDDVLANACIEAGAQHYLRKADIQPLSLRRAITYAVSRNRAEADKQHATEQLDRFFDISTDLLSIAGADGYFKRLNPAWEHTLGISADELMSRPYAEFVHPDDAARTGAEMAEQIAAGVVTMAYENRYRCGDGTYRWLSWNATSTLHDGLIYAVARDLTATKDAEASQRIAEERAQQGERMASLGQLAGGVAHDFNNLLGIILNFTTFAVEQAADLGEEAIQADLAQVRLATERAADLTRQLLTFTRQDTVRPEILDVNAAVAEANAMLARTIGTHIDLIATQSPTPLMISADAGHLQQILVNLAVNARDAMPDGGTLTIDASAVDLDDRQAHLHPAPVAGRYVQLLVSDTGSGMSPEVVARMFEPFYTTKPTGQGTGLGLATVYGIITAAEGSVGVYSEPGVGTTFRVYFPIADTLGGSAPPLPDAANAPHGHGQTVLVVEDEPAPGRSVGRILDSGGYRILSAGGGSEALELNAEHGCDLVLTDVVMTGMSGPRLARLLHDDRPQLPVLFMSGYTNGLLGSAHILDEGVTFIEKPFTAHYLLTEVDRVFAALAALP
jgi:two-component system cell cycle sensor histidine kinase/response regulator CckA